MKKELDELLCENYPKIFAHRHGDMTMTAMCWGFDHGDGWFDIINALCARIQHHIDWRNNYRKQAIEYNIALNKAKNGDLSGLVAYFSYGSPDWAHKMAQNSLEGDEREVPDEVPQVVASQVKEKFGTLRFYYDGGDDYIRGLVSMAEWASANFCEECGERGKLIGTTWLYTACKNHTREEDKNE